MPHLLLIEDNPLTRRLVRAAVERAGFALAEATSGAAAMEALEGQRPDIVLQDLALPDCTSVDLLRKLRAHPATSGAPILALTGLLSKEDEARVLSAGFDGLVTKPIEPSRLSRDLLGHLASRHAEQRPPFGSGKRLLLADDDPQQLKLIRFRLSKLGFTVETANDGLEALELARVQPPDVVVTDALMPRLDGFGLCLAMRREPGLSSIPVVLATASYLEDEDRKLAHDAGVTAYVVRTPDLAEVIRAIERAVNRGDRAQISEKIPTSEQHVESVRAIRAARQLDRQVQANSGLVQRCSTLAAELAVLSTVAEALVDVRDVEAALFEILDNCLDAAGASAGAIYRRGPDGALTRIASHGITVSDEGDRALVELLNQVPETGGATCLPEPATVGLSGTALALPLFARGRALGMLVLDPPASGATAEDRFAFAEAIARQLGLALSLTDAFRNVEDSDARTKALMDSAEDAIFVTTEEGVVLEANKAGERLLRLSQSELVGRPLGKFIRDEANPHGPTLRDDVMSGAATVARAEGPAIPVEYTSSRVTIRGETNCMIIVRDVSARNAMAEQLRQSQKMEAVGRLAGGIAHDFNNMLSVVLTYCHCLLEDLDSEDPHRADIEEIRRAGDRAAQLTRQLLAFSRQQVLQPEVVAVNDIIQGLVKMVSRVIGENIQIAVDLAPDIGRVRADVGQLHQVLLNLTVNARDAMPDGGTLTFVTRNLDGNVNIIVSDTGTGMDEATLARIFEPFFTTKSPGKGTGLGLATVFGIIDQSGGTVRVESKVGAGTSFRICLPSSNEEAATISSLPPEIVATRGSETILLVEDESAVRTVVTNVLLRAGYHVLAAPGPGDALLIAEQHQGNIDLLLTDLVMPHMNGAQLAERLVTSRPAMRVLVMSGYANTEGVRLGDLGAEVPFLQKPLTPAAVLKKVREVLEGPRRRWSSTGPMAPVDLRALRANASSRGVTPS